MRTISCTLSEDSIDRALREVEEYKQRLKRKADEISNKIGELLEREMTRNFEGAYVDVLTDASGGGAISANVSVFLLSARSDGIAIVVASGYDAVWVEFGTGVHFNSPAGSNPNPLASAIGASIGGYGQGRGNQDKWAFKSGDTLMWTLGVPAQMPIYRAIQSVRNQIIGIVREVFARD